jgi:hypothetical protein
MNTGIQLSFTQKQYVNKDKHLARTTAMCMLEPTSCPHKEEYGMYSGINIWYTEQQSMLSGASKFIHGKLGL